MKWQNTIVRCRGKVKWCANTETCRHDGSHSILDSRISYRIVVPRQHYALAQFPADSITVRLATQLGENNGRRRTLHEGRDDATWIDSTAPQCDASLLCAHISLVRFHPPPHCSACPKYQDGGKQMKTTVKYTTYYNPSIRVCIGLGKSATHTHPSTEDGGVSHPYTISCTFIRARTHLSQSFAVLPPPSHCRRHGLRRFVSRRWPQPSANHPPAALSISLVQYSWLIRHTYAEGTTVAPTTVVHRHMCSLLNFSPTILPLPHTTPTNSSVRAIYLVKCLSLVARVQMAAEAHTRVSEKEGAASRIKPNPEIKINRPHAGERKKDRSENRNCLERLTFART
ncbi:hypothetical protein CBL_09767 [Carabus blaptoides fortunei]